MKIFFYLSVLFLSIDFSYGQLYEGTTMDKNKSYHCLICINKDSSINFIYDRGHGEVYAEYKGTIQRINDSIYHVSASMTVGQFYMKAIQPDTLYIQLDSTIARQLDKIEVKYSNGTINGVYEGYDRQGRPIRTLKIPVDQTFFNSSKGSDYVTLTINRKNQVYGNWLNFRIPYGSGASFTRDETENFYIKIKNGQIQTEGKPPIQTGHFKLKKKSGK